MELNLSLSLPDVMFQELLEAARECRCSPKIFAAQSLESVLRAVTVRGSGRRKLEKRRTYEVMQRSRMRAENPGGYTFLRSVQDRT